MAISFFQKMRLAFRGWSRRREDEAKRKQEEFLRKNTAWAPPSPPISTNTSPSAAGGGGAPLRTVDLEGLQAAYLDGSGVIVYYLDVETGDVVETRDGSAMDAARYKRVPARGSENDERRAFIETLEPSNIKQMLMKSVASPTFRSVLASDRTIERAWYNFRNAHATQAIESWLKKSGLR